MKFVRTALLIAISAGALVSCKDDKILPVALRYHWLTSPAAVTLNDFKTVLSAPPGFAIAQDDCPGVATDQLMENLDQVDNAIRSPTGALPTVGNSFWLGSVTAPSETSFSFVSTEGAFSASLSTGGQPASVSTTPGTRAHVEASLNDATLQLVFATVRRRIDLSMPARACLARAAARACTQTGHGANVSFVSSILFGTLIRLGSQKLRIGTTTQVTLGQPFEFRVNASFDRSDITGGWIGRLGSPSLMTATDVQRVSGDGGNALLDFPQMIEMVRSQRYVELGSRLDAITQQYGAIAVETQVVSCNATAPHPKS